MNYQYFAYLQDEIRLTPTLSLSLGVRYETATVPSEADDKVAALIDPLHDAELTIGGQPYLNPSKGNFAPRASLAWDPFGDDTTVPGAPNNGEYPLLYALYPSRGRDAGVEVQYRFGGR